MALAESEVRVLALLGLVIVVLWIFFGLFWSLLLVFTFLIYAYKFGRTETGNTHYVETQSSAKTKEKNYEDAIAEKLKDVPFTAAMPNAKFVTLRSPLPLLSEVTRRLSFNVSKTTPFPLSNSSAFHAAVLKRNFNGINDSMNRSWHLGGIGSPYRSGRSSFYRRPNHFSLLSPISQQPSTVKIASPGVMRNASFTLSESHMKKAINEVENPCSKEAVLSAIKNSRKRSVNDDDDDLELTFRPTKRRSYLSEYMEQDKQEPVKTGFGGLKRTAIHEKSSGPENTVKLKKFSHDSSLKRLKEADKDKETSHKRKMVSVDTQSKSSQSSNLVNQHKSEEDAGVKAKKPKTKSPTYHTIQRSPSAEEDCHITTVSTDSRRSVTVVENENVIDNTDKQKLASKDKVTSSGTQQTAEVNVQHVNTSPLGEKQQKCKGDQPDMDGGSAKEKKRFVVPRFPSKDDSRRRSVPVYCASTAEYDIPQRRPGSRKVTQNQIKIDRQLAWERVRELLDGFDDEEDNETKGNETQDTSVTPASESDKKVTSPASQSTAAAITVTPSTSFKVPSLAASSGNLDTCVTSNQASAKGDPQNSKLSVASPFAQGNTLVEKAVTQSQSSVAAASQARNALGSSLVSSFPSGLTTNVTATLTSVVVSSCVQETSVKPPTTATNILNQLLTFPQVNAISASPAASSQSTVGAQLSSSGSFLGASAFSNPTTNSSTSLPVPTQSGTTSAPQPAFGFTVPSALASTAAVGFQAVPSTAGSASSSSAPPPGQGGASQFAFGNASSATQAVIGMTSSQNTSSPVSSLGMFASRPSTTQSAFGFGNTSTQSGFVNIARSTQNTFGSTTMQGGFGSSQNLRNNSNTMSENTAGTKPNQNTTQSAFGASSTSLNVFSFKPNQTAGQSPFGIPSGQNAFGANVTQNANQSGLGALASQSSFTAQSNQGSEPSSFGTQQSKNAFGSQLKKSPTQNSFGTQSTQSPFGAPNLFRTQTTQNAFGGQPKQPVTQSTFGANLSQNTFGAQLNQTAAQSTFGSQSRNAFGVQPKQSGFGATSQFSFAGGQSSAQNRTNSPFSGGFGNTAQTSQTSNTGFGNQNMFGSSKNTAGTHVGFNFNSSTSSGGFNFGAATNQPAQFQFGSSNTTAFGGFGQTANQPAASTAVPTTPASSGGFNFAPGSSGGTSFAAAPSTPLGNNAVAAKARARSAARRRGKK